MILFPVSDIITFVNRCTKGVHRLSKIIIDRGGSTMLSITINVDLVSIFHQLFSFLFVILFLYLVYQNDEAYMILTFLENFCFVYQQVIGYTQLSTSHINR